MHLVVHEMVTKSDRIAICVRLCQAIEYLFVGKLVDQSQLVVAKCVFPNGIEGEWAKHPEKN